MKFIFSFLLLFSPGLVPAQHLLRIMSTDNEEGFLIQEGEYMGYWLKSDTNFYKGEIVQIKDSSIVINNKEIFLRELEVIALKGESKKNILWGIGIFTFEAALIGTNELVGGDRVLNQVVLNSLIPAVIVGSFLIIRGIIKHRKYDKYLIGQDWSIAIVPPEKK